MKYNVIAIEREYASGGKEIGEKLAQKLGIPFYEKEILQRAADKIGLSPSELQDIEESMTGSFLYGLHVLAGVSSGTADGLTVAQRLAMAESEVIRELALNPCVIVGRCATGVLKDNKKVLRVFVYSDLNMRKKRALEVYKINAKNIETILTKTDKRRSTYFKATAGVERKSPSNYHIALDSGKLGIDNIVEILYTAVK